MELAFYWQSMRKSNIYTFKNCNCDKRCEGEFKNARKICNSMFEGWGCGWAGTLPWGDLRINQEKGGKGVCYRQGTACAKARQGSKQIRNEGSRRKGPGVSWGWAGGRQADPARLCRQLRVLLCRPTENNWNLCRVLNCGWGDRIRLTFWKDYWLQCRHRLEGRARMHGLLRYMLPWTRACKLDLLKNGLKGLEFSRKQLAFIF